MLWLVLRAANRSRVVPLIASALLTACATPPAPRIQVGPEAVVTADGLHKVDNVQFGTLFMKPNYAFGSYDRFVLDKTLVTIEPGSRILDPEAVEVLKARFNKVAREAIAKTGRTEVTESGACVALINLALVDLRMLKPHEFGGARTTVVSSFGAVTLVLEIRDGLTGEPLLRYGRRRPLEGGQHVGTDPAQGAALESAFERFAADFQRDFTDSLPRVAPTARTLTCAQRAGAAPFTPEADAAREMEQTLAFSPDLDNGRRIYQICAKCHQPTGWGSADGSAPQLAGQHSRVLIKQLADIRAGNRDSPTMYPFAYESRIGGAQTVADVAGYISTLEMSVETGKGPGDDLGRGEGLYAQNCARCHGARGEGDNDRYMPRIQSQHYAYLVRQFQWIKDGQRRNADPEMKAQIQNFSGEEIHAVLDYVSRLAPSP